MSNGGSGLPGMPLPPQAPPHVTEAGIGGGLCMAATDGSVVSDPTAKLEATGTFGQPGFVPAGAVANAVGDFNITMPECTSKIRGILLQNGADNQSGVGAARLWGFAFIRGSVWTSDRTREQQFDRMLQVIEDFAIQTGHPELRNAPIVIQGGSRTSEFSFYMAARVPERVIAWVTDALGPNSRDITPASLKVPGLITVGENDHATEVVNGSMKPLRAQGGLVAAAMKWQTGHELKHAHQLIWPFIDQVIRARLPPDADPSAGPVVLNEYPAEKSWLGNVDNWSQAAPAAEYAGDPATAAWLPNEYTARIWQSFNVKEPAAVMESPAGYGRLGKYGGSFGGGFASYLTPLTLMASVNRDGVGAHFFSGSWDLGQGVFADGKLKLENVLIPPGIRPIAVCSASGEPLSRPVGLTILGDRYSVTE